MMNDENATNDHTNKKRDNTNHDNNIIIHTRHFNF